MMSRRDDVYLNKNMDVRCLGVRIGIGDAVKTIKPFEVTRHAAAAIKGVLPNGSKEPVKCAVDEEIVKINNTSVHSNTYVNTTLMVCNMRHLFLTQLQINKSMIFWSLATFESKICN